MASSTPTRRSRDRRAAKEEIAPAGSPDSRRSEHLDMTVRFPPSDALRLYSSAHAQNSHSLNSFARQITKARVNSVAPTSQTSSIKVQRAPLPRYPAVVVCRVPALCAEHPADRVATRLRHNSQTHQSNSRRVSLHTTRSVTPHSELPSDNVVYVVAHLMSRCAD